MKKTLMTTMIACFMVTTGFAQGRPAKGNDTLKAARKEHRLLKDKQSIQANTDRMEQELTKEFGPVTNIRWERIADYNWAYFNKGGQHLTAIYDDDNSRVGTISNKSFSDLPANAQAHINEHYAGYEKGTVILYDDNEFNKSDMKLYDQQFDEADNFFVTLQKGNKKLVLKVNMQGDVAFFNEL